MGRTPDEDVERAEPPKVEPSAAEPPGRVEVDSRGHNVWRWTREANDSTSVVLKRLDNEDLALEPTQKVPVVRGAGAAPKSAAPKNPAPKNPAQKGAAQKGAAHKGAAQKGPAQKAAAPKAASPEAPPAKGKKSTSDARASKSAFHPAIQRDDERDGGGGFDPYNSR